MIPGGAAGAPGNGIVWARVEDGFHVGSRTGEFVGYIDRQADGRYLAYDSRSSRVGAFTDLTTAMRTLALGATPDIPDEAPPIELREIR
ncbi:MULTISPECIES: hypothetical protein [Microbacterium]|jgi:hypothetical protein|uniref:hypothetical protein n=1 Tax=Microbacterium TaxID=33882 RepID=UPI000E745998|nr:MULTISPECIES: hypothetical protein [Microbacterium]MDF2580231.1 hypothetical protein [Microbacterium sp.]RKE64958.1 hypothetical protein DEU36_2195 [Microbacterium sp. AG238]WJM15468.1 hypothetical protein QUC20_14495 [Microbacterium arborescens]